MADEQTPAAEGQAPASDGTENTEQAQQPQGRTFTQDDVEKLIHKRVMQERKAWEAKQEEETKRAQMSAEEKLKADLSAAEQRGKQALQEADNRVVRAESRVVAVALGIKPERVSAALKLADLSQVTVDETGEPDGAAIKAALEAVLTDLPELKGEQGQRAAGGIPASPRGQAAPIPSREQLIAEEKERRRRTYGGF